MSIDETRLRRMLDRPETDWILSRVRARLSQGKALTGRITLPNASEEERIVAARLLGRSVSSGRSASLSLDRLDAVLRESETCTEGLASAVAFLRGPVEDPRRRRAAEAAWRAVDADLARLADEKPELAPWASGVSSRGQLKRVASGPAEAASYIQNLRVVARALPADGEPIARFSARVLGRAHALDAGTPLGGLAAAVAEALGRSEREDDGGAPPSDARGGSSGWRRAAWASVGVLVDDLSSTVLVLDLPGLASAAGTAGALALLGARGQPAVLTLRQVVADDLGAVPRDVYVCENPAVVAAAADRLSGRAHPLVCLQGQPGAAAMSLLRRLRAGGATLRYHGDFDWGGVTIARTLASRVDWLPWRFRAGDYLRALERSTDLGSLPELSRKRQETPWDPALASAMIDRAVGVEEELVLEEMLADLAVGSS